jgi:phenylacetate-CoA ligase
MNCKVYDYYGCGECNSLGFQCKEGTTYHISEEHVVLEVKAESGQTHFVGRGQTLITDLDNYAMPLLRYENGDYLTIGQESCVCGRSLKLISKLEGRTSGFLLSATGQLVSGGICDFIMANVHSVDEFQVRQDALDHIRVFLVARQKLTASDFNYIRDAFRYYLGETVDVEMTLVDSIPRTRVQKLRTAINEILENQLESSNGNLSDF